MNTGRQNELDVARGLAVFFLVLVHVQMLLAMEHVQATRIGQAFAFVQELDIGLSSSYRATITTRCSATSSSPLSSWAGSVYGTFLRLGYPRGSYRYCSVGAKM